MGAALNQLAPAPLKFIIRPLGTARGEAQFVKETTLKVRWPHRDGVTWRGWEAKCGPMVDEWMDSGRVAVAESGGVIVGFAVWRDPRTLAMLYVKAGLRGNGFGLKLLADWPRDKVKVLQPTPCWRRWADHHGIAWEATA
jgi:hypothetical protein